MGTTPRDPAPPGELKVILFDMGNTLVFYQIDDWKSILDQCLSATWSRIRAHGILENPEVLSGPLKARMFVTTGSHLNPQTQAIPLERRLLDAARESRLSGESVTSLKEAMPSLMDAFYEPIGRTIEPYPDVQPALKDLADRELTLGIVSNSPWDLPSRYSIQELERLGLKDFFTSLVFSADCPYRKPHPSIFERALAELEARPQEALFVGDNPLWDVEAPQRLGMRAVLRVDSRFRYDVQVSADHTVTDLTELLTLREIP